MYKSRFCSKYPVWEPSFAQSILYRVWKIEGGIGAECPIVERAFRPTKTKYGCAELARNGPYAIIIYDSRVRNRRLCPSGWKTWMQSYIRDVGSRGDVDPMNCGILKNSKPKPKVEIDKSFAIRTNSPIPRIRKSKVIKKIHSYTLLVHDRCNAGLTLLCSCRGSSLVRFAYLMEYTPKYSQSKIVTVPQHRVLRSPMS